MIDQVRADMTSAMKAAEKERAGALRLVLSELQKAAKDGGSDELAARTTPPSRKLAAAHDPANNDYGQYTGRIMLFCIMP